MGDSRIIIALGDLEHKQNHTTTIENNNNNNNNNNTTNEYKFFKRTLLADSTFREIVDIIQTIAQENYPSLSIHTSSSSSKSSQDNKKNDSSNQNDKDYITLTFVDYTYHPPKEIFFDSSNNQLTGPSAVTLQQMGWFPSGKIVVLRNDDVQGKQNALHSNLAVLEKNEKVEIVSVHQKETAMRNNDDNNDTLNETNTNQRVLLLNKTTSNNAAASASAVLPLPSQILNAVTTRFDTFDDDNDEKDAISSPLKKKQHIRVTEKQRCARLDESILALEKLLSSKDTKQKNTKQQSINNKVRQMLVKSRSEGDKRLREEDRFYLEVISISDLVPQNDDDGDENNNNTRDSNVMSSSKSFRFFSIMSTIGKLAESVKMESQDRNTKLDLRVEVLVKRQIQTTSTSTSPPTTTIVYRRLPNNMSLFEVESKGFLSKFDPIVVRSYIHNNDSIPTTSILEKDETYMENDPNTSSLTSTPPIDNTDLNSSTTQKEEKDKPPSHESNETIEKTDLDVDLDSVQDNDKKIAQEIYNAIESMELTTNQQTKKKIKKSNTKTSEKVRQMLMKSKSKGDKTIKEPDRFYLEVVVVKYQTQTQTREISAQSSNQFFRKRTTIEKLVSSKLLDELSPEDNVEMLVEISQNKEGSGDGDVPTFAAIPKTWMLVDAESKGFLKQFHRIIVRQFPSSLLATKRLAGD